MRAALAAVILLGSALFAATPVFEPLPRAGACSCPDCDGIRDADVIVGGRITGWSLSEDVRFPELTDAQPLDISLEVDRVFKGAAPRDLVLYDPTSLSSYEQNGERMWMGGSGGCQAFSRDPTGAYVVVRRRRVKTEARNRRCRCQSSSWLVSTLSPRASRSSR